MCGELLPPLVVLMVPQSARHSPSPSHPAPDPQRRSQGHSRHCVTSKVKSVLSEALLLDRFHRPAARSGLCRPRKGPSTVRASIQSVPGTDEALLLL